MSVMVAVNSPRSNNIETIGLASRISPTLAGSASRNIPRKADASDERISSTLPKRVLRGKGRHGGNRHRLGNRGLRHDHQCKPVAQALNASSAILEPRLLLTQKFNWTIAAPNMRGPIN